MTSDRQMFAVRIHCIDYCLAVPTQVDVDASRAPLHRLLRKRQSATTTATNPTETASETDTSKSTSSTYRQDGFGPRSPRIPLIRVFGTTPTGETACARIHGAFPYLFVPFDAQHFRQADAERVMQQLRRGIDQALGRTVVLAVTLARGVPFYGFHVGLQLFFKIYLLDPAAVPRAAELLRQGRVGGLPVLQPHEAHVPFVLQFMTDYNLYGCDVLRASAVARQSCDAGDSGDAGGDILEVDIFAHHIRNRDAAPERRQHESIPETPVDPDERLVYSMASLWREMAGRYGRADRKAGADEQQEQQSWEVPGTRPPVNTQEAFAQLAASASDPRRTPSAWHQEAAYRRQMADIIAAERAAERRKNNADGLHAAHGVSPDSLDECVPTTRQSVEDFYPASERTENRKQEQESSGSCDIGTGELQGLPCEKTATEVATETGDEGASFSLSPDSEMQMMALVDQQEVGSGSKRALLPSRGQQGGHHYSGSSQNKKKGPLPQQTRQQAQRPLTQIFTVTKSSFPRERQEKTAETAVDIVIPSTPEHEVMQLPTTPTTPTPLVKTDCAVAPSTPYTREMTCSTDSVTTPKDALRHVADGVLALTRRPPRADDVVETLERHGVDELHPEPFFSDERDIVKNKYDNTGAGRRLPVRLPAFAPPLTDGSGPLLTRDTSTSSVLPACSSHRWELARLPPSVDDVETWLANEDAQTLAKAEAAAVDAAVTEQRMTKARLPWTERKAAAPARPEKPQQPKARAPRDAMRVLVLELHANSRGTFLPNPERDPVQCVFWRVAESDRDADRSAESGVILVQRALRDEQRVEVAADERDLLDRIVRLVRRLDPDILAGYETVASSWGYLAERAALYIKAQTGDEDAAAGMDLWQELGRVRQPREAATYERGHQAYLVTGRHVLAIGAAVQADAGLRQYTLASAAWQLLRLRVPAYAPQVLTGWATSGRSRDLARLVRFGSRRAAVGAALLRTTEFVARTSEQARVLGVDFAAVLGRGSQYKVESVMLRVAKPECFVLPSPSHEQVGRQKAAEVAPLVLEPRSGLYSSPVVVLDFASLYPSLMIAYNLCYSTFLGGLDPLYEEKKKKRERDRKRKNENAEKEQKPIPSSGSVEGEAKTAADTAIAGDGPDGPDGPDDPPSSSKKMGFTTYERPSGLLERLDRLGVVVAPTGMMYAGATTRQSLLAKMLSEILRTRFMVKAAMGQTDGADDAASEKQRLHHRQLALKLLANVTYGYTSASFSGRMPCVELADSIVQAGRQTLDRAMSLIHADARWQPAEVVYGDTDSLFVHLPGRTRAQAFAIGAAMAAAVTAANPAPVRLKFEKVYHPCVLLAKKRYVGYRFDSLRQTVPAWDAKGIETVRRDGTPAASALLEASLRLLFDTADLSRVRRLVQQRCADVLRGDVSPADLCFSRQIRSPSSYRAPPPGAVVAARHAARDPRAALMPDGDRVPFVIVAGPPGTPMRDRCVAPAELVRSRHLHLDGDYYVRHSLLPPLDRVLRLVGVDVAQWYADMVRPPKAGGGASLPSWWVPGVGGSQVEGEGEGADEDRQQTLDTWLKQWRCARCSRSVRRQPRKTARRREAPPAAGRRSASSPSRYQLPPSPPPPTPPPLCRSCGNDPHTLAVLQTRARETEAAYRTVLDACRGCAGLGAQDPVRCENMICAVFWERASRAAQARAERAKAPLVAVLARRGMEDLEW